MQQKIRNILESWDITPFEQQDKSVEDIRYEVKELQFFLAGQSDQDCEAFMNFLFLEGIFLSLIVIKMAPIRSDQHCAAPIALRSLSSRFNRSDCSDRPALTDRIDQLRSAPIAPPAEAEVVDPGPTSDRSTSLRSLQPDRSNRSAPTAPIRPDHRSGQRQASSAGAKESGGPAGGGGEGGGGPHREDVVVPAHAAGGGDVEVPEAPREAQGPHLAGQEEEVPELAQQLLRLLLRLPLGGVRLAVALALACPPRPHAARKGNRGRHRPGDRARGPLQRTAPQPRMRGAAGSRAFGTGEGGEGARSKNGAAGRGWGRATRLSALRCPTWCRAAGDGQPQRGARRRGTVKHREAARRLESNLARTNHIAAAAGYDSHGGVIRTRSIRRVVTLV